MEEDEAYGMGEDKIYQIFEKHNITGGHAKEISELIANSDGGELLCAIIAINKQIPDLCLDTAKIHMQFEKHHVRGKHAEQFIKLIKESDSEKLLCIKTACRKQITHLGLDSAYEDWVKESE